MIADSLSIERLLSLKIFLPNHRKICHKSFLLSVETTYILNFSIWNVEKQDEKIRLRKSVPTISTKKIKKSLVVNQIIFVLYDDIAYVSLRKAALEKCPIITAAKCFQIKIGWRKTKNDMEIV